VPVDERIAVFDNDGTLWCEKPMPIKLGFILLRLATMEEVLVGGRLKAFEGHAQGSDSGGRLGLPMGRKPCSRRI
jgi:hypothetical protein